MNQADTGLHHQVYTHHTENSVGTGCFMSLLSGSILSSATLFVLYLFLHH